MLPTLPSGRLGRAIAIGATLSLIAAIWFAVALPLRTGYLDGQSALAGRTALAGRMAALVSQIPALSEQAARLGVSGSPAGLLPGDSDALAAAKLQEIVQGLAAAAAITPTSIEILPAVPVGHDRRIALRLAVVVRFPVLIGWLQSIAQTNPHMLVDDLNLEAGQLINQPVDTQLHVDLTISAFRAASPVEPLSTAALGSH